MDFDDAIACNDAYVDKGAVLRGEAVVCDNAYISMGAVLSGHARAEDNAYIRGAVLSASARASGFSMILNEIPWVFPFCLATARSMAKYPGMCV